MVYTNITKIDFTLLRKHPKVTFIEGGNDESMKFLSNIPPSIPSSQYTLLQEPPAYLLCRN